MMDESSKRRKKKRGRSLIFKTCFRPATSGNDNGGKILASDDNLVYCDVTTSPNANVDHPEVKKSSSSRGRMSRIFKAVLFDTAMKKKMRGRRSSSKASFESVTSSPGPPEKIEDPFDDMNNNPNNMKILEADNSSHDTSSKTDATPVASSCPSIDNSTTSSTSPTLTEQKVTPRVNSMDKKPPLIPSASRPPVKPVHDQKDSNKNNVALKNSSFRVYMFTSVVVFVLVILWKSYTAIYGVKSLDVESKQYTNIVVVGDEL